MTLPASEPAPRVSRPLRTSSGLAGWLRRANLGDRLFKLVCQTAAALVVLVTVLLVGVLCWYSALALGTLGLGFFSSKDWDPVHDHYGALAFIWGTLVTSVLAMLIAVPLGIGTAAYLAEIAGAGFRRFVAFAVELLAAIPSVVYGFWGMFVLAPTIQTWLLRVGGPNNAGRGILTTSLVLAVMIVPYVTAVSFDVLRAVPASQRQASLALGATRWQTIWRVLFPYARPGIVAACFIALGRALGETMAATMLIGNRADISFSPFGLGDTIASRIANQLPEANSPLYRSALMELGLILFAVTMLVNVVARMLIWQMGTGRDRLAAVFARVPYLGPALTAFTHAVGHRRHPAQLPCVPSDHGQPVAGPRPVIPRINPQAQRIDRVMTGVLFACVIVTIVPPAAHPDVPGVQGRRLPRLGVFHRAAPPPG